VISDRFPLASWFLLIAGLVFTFAFALPLLFVPLRWAQLFRWKLPAETDLTVYFARCLGAVAVALVGACFLAVPHPEQHLLLFDLVTIAGAMLAGVHAWGAIARTQPWTETLEIALYAGITVATHLLRRSLES